MKNEKRKLFSVFDVFIILIVLLISVYTLISQLNKPDSNLICSIKLNGQEVYCVELDHIDGTQKYEVECDMPLTVVIKSNGVYVEAVNCPDKLCEHTGTITRSGQSIVCLPAKVSVTLISGNKEIDAVVG